MGKSRRQSLKPNEWNKHNMSNTSKIALGLELHRDGSAMAQAGIATMVTGVSDSFTYGMRWSYGSGDNEVSGVCMLSDMFKPRRHEDGSADGKFLPAMYRALADNFGIEGGMSSADKMAFQRAFTVAAAGWSGSPVEVVTATVQRKGKAVKVQAIEVPASVAFDLVDDKGAPNELGQELVERVRSTLEIQNLPVPDDAKLFEQAQALKVRCVGGNNPIFGKVPSASDIANKLSPVAVAGGYMQSKGNRTKAANADKFGESLDYVTKCVVDVLLNDDETAFAPSTAIEDKLRGLAWKGYTLLLIALVVLPLPFGAMTPGAWAGAAIGLVLCLPMIAGGALLWWWCGRTAPLR
jgi:hypothetical protein